MNMIYNRRLVAEEDFPDGGFWTGRGATPTAGSGTTANARAGRQDAEHPAGKQSLDQS